MDAVGSNDVAVVARSSGGFSWRTRAQRNAKPITRGEEHQDHDLGPAVLAALLPLPATGGLASCASLPLAGGRFAGSVPGRHASLPRANVPTTVTRVR